MADSDAIRYLQIAQVDLAESCFGLAIANVRHRPTSSGHPILGPGAGARAATTLEPVSKHWVNWDHG
jgi:hypothetical protein